jgi:hypothetical protein
MIKVYFEDGKKQRHRRYLNKVRAGGGFEVIDVYANSVVGEFSTSEDAQQFLAETDDNTFQAQLVETWEKINGKKVEASVAQGGM